MASKKTTRRSAATPPAASAKKETTSKQKAGKANTSKAAADRASPDKKASPDKPAADRGSPSKSSSSKSGGARSANSRRGAGDKSAAGSAPSDTGKAAATGKAAPSGTQRRAPRGAEPSATKSSRGAGQTSGMVRIEREIGGRTLMLETGRMAKLADGAIVARYGDTMVLATAQGGPENPNVDFFPLTVDYREKAAAAGKFPGGFFKREGRPTTREILTCRIIDRSIRPLFAEGFLRETQVLSQVLCTDKENESDILAAVASYAAIGISSLPNTKILGSCRIGLINDELIINPTWSQLQSPENKLNLTISAHEDAIVMVEAGAQQVPEDVMLEALELGHEVCREVASMIAELVAQVGKQKLKVVPPERDTKLFDAMRKKFGQALADAATSGGPKAARGAAVKAVKAEVSEAFPPPANATEAQAAKHKKFVSEYASELCKQGERESVLAGRRADGRDWTTIRPLSIEVDVLPRVHGSSLFTRGETQALCIATLGTADDRQFMDGIYPEERRRWLLHYAFPPFSVGETKRVLAPGRREIGHGALAERAIEPMLPSATEFPYSLRVTSEVLESNGSSSMATVCGATLALMDAGVPLIQPVAGIAMGLVVEGKRVAILSDILGSEDHCGDMDFKVAGTGRGITALQMDIKCEGLARETLEQALEQAREGRLHLLREMLNVIRKPRAEISPNAPRLVSIQVPVEKIGAIIGPSGRNIRGLQEDFEVRISVGDEGRVEVAGIDAKKVNDCVERIRLMTADIEIGTVYKGKVTGIKEFGAFVELVPGQEGLCHVSELADGFIRSVTDVVQMGDIIEVKVIDIDDFGKIKLSRRALLQGGGAPSGDAPPPRGGDRGDRGGRPEGRGRDRDAGPGGRPRRDDDRARPRRDRDEVVEPVGQVEPPVVEASPDEPRGERGPRRDRPFGGGERSRRPDDRGDRGDRPRGRTPHGRPSHDDVEPVGFGGGRPPIDVDLDLDPPHRGDRRPRSGAAREVDDAPPAFEGRRGPTEGRGDRGPFRGDRGPRPEREDRGPRADRPGRFDAPPRGEREDRPLRTERPMRDDRPVREDRPMREDRPLREDRPMREDRPPRGERPMREDRPVREDRPMREDRPLRDDRPVRSERPMRDAQRPRDERSDRPERFERGDRAERFDRPERAGREPRPAELEREDRFGAGRGRSDAGRDERPARRDREGRTPFRGADVDDAPVRPERPVAPRVDDDVDVARGPQDEAPRGVRRRRRGHRDEPEAGGFGDAGAEFAPDFGDAPDDESSSRRRRRRR